jgi:phosphopantetheine adenylyltransferase
MKSLLKFISEARRSQAVMQAQKLGFRSDGHGGWYDEKGEFVAKTVGGQLQFFNKGQQDGQDPPQSEKDKKLSGEGPTEDQRKAEAEKAAAADIEAAQGGDDAENMPQGKAPAPESQNPVQTKPADVPKTKGTLTVAFGRFNPPTTGHEKLLDKVASSSDEEDYVIVPSRSEDKKKNPLGADRKVEIMRMMYPKHSEKIVNDAQNRTIFDVLRKAHNDGYANVRIVGGADRVKEFEKLTNKYNGSTYQFDNIEVLSAGERDPDSEGVEGMSASKMRKAAKDGDFRSFKKGLPKGIDNETAVALFTELQDAMGVKQKSTAEDWEIAPRLFQKTLRENYILEKIYNIGEWITHDATGMVAKIVRKGTNYLICVTEDNIMFKTWIKDVNEAKKYTEVTMDRRERLPGKPNTLFGTTGYRKNLEAITPGEPGSGVKWGKQFIQKYRNQYSNK